MILAIDIGNTNILFGEISDSGKIEQQLRIKTDLIIKNYDNLETFLTRKLSKFSLSDFKKFIIAGVVPDVERQVKLFLSNKHSNIKIIEINNHVLSKFININIDNPAEVGSDRLINSISALNNFKAPLIIVDFGTATTFDIVDKESSYVGGLICPGIELSIESLAKRTAKLPLISFKRTQRIIGKSTISAMESGIYWGYVSLVNGLIKMLKSESNFKDSTVIATGGFSNLFENDLREVDHFISDLTLSGIFLVYKKLK